MAYMLKELIEHDTDGKVKGSIINNLGSATIQHNALMNGDADVSSTRYTGTDLVGALEQKPITDSTKAMHVTKKLFNQKLIKRFLIHMVLKTRLPLWSQKKQPKNTTYILFQI